MANGNWLSRHFKRYGYKTGVIMLVAKITHAFFCKPFFRLLSKRYQVADANCILFDSVPDFADNARALYDHMIKEGMNQRYQIFWLVEDPDKYQKAAPVNVHFVKRQGKWSERYTLAAHKATWQAGTIFFTHSMYQQMHRPAGQKRINLWHGCGYKAAKGGSQNISFDKLLVPSQLFVETKSTFFGRATEDFLPIGYPRYDEIVQKNETARAALEKKKQSCGAKKALIWMPTYRASSNARFSDDTLNSPYQLPLVSNTEQLSRLNAVCKKQRLLLLIKYHGMQKKGQMLESFSNLQLIDENFFTDNPFSLYHFLGVMDGLITDYSSVAVDFLLVDKPIAYVLEDYERYAKSRGFVFDDPRIYMPGAHVYTLEDLEHFLVQIGEDVDEKCEERKQLMPVLLNPCDGYAKRVLDAFGLS